MPKCVGGIMWPSRILRVIFGRLKLISDTRVIHFDYALSSFILDETETFTYKRETQSKQSFSD